MPVWQVGSLNLDIAPFRLSAIVNRIDLGATTAGPGPYGAPTSLEPTTAGELRFVFGAQNLGNCSQLEFTVILEYGVPITGCKAVRDWALDWTRLNDPLLATRFTSPWRMQLADMTERVVIRNAAPNKGNQSAINQVRTNEIALGSPWELREFTLSKENPATGIDTPVNGALRRHTVAMTPNDSKYNAVSDPRIDAFVLGGVLASVPPVVGSSTGTLPVLTNCSASYTVPHVFQNQKFRGGNSLAGPSSWNVAVANPGNLREVCAREQFSLNTCNGCHLGDTSTKFYHVNPMTMPATLSNFLTGGNTGIWSVPDAQFSSTVASMEFRDLDRRHTRLYQIACAPCAARLSTASNIVEMMAKVAGVLPIDPIDPDEAPFPVGPIVDLDVVKQLIDLRIALTDPDVSTELELGKSVRAGEISVH